jgi:Na+/H+ antiporter NhaD/arsenite permease-like protein
MSPIPIDKPALLAIFALTYFGIAAGHVPGLKLDRTGIALLGAIAVMVFGGLPTDAVVGLINWPTLLLLFGFFVLSAQLRLSGLFDALAGRVARRLDEPRRFLLALMAVTAGLSAVLNHDIVCFVFTPVVATALQRRRIDPVPFLVALVIASNIGAAATPVGNPQGMMIVQFAGLSFGPWVLWCLPPVLFALGAGYLLLWRLSRERLSTPAPSTPAPASSSTPASVALSAAPLGPQPFDRAHTVKGLVVLAIALVLFFTPLPKELVALTAAAVHLASPKFRTRDLLNLVDWPILVLFMSLFVVTGAFERTGYGQQAFAALAHAGLDLRSPAVLALTTAALSNLVGNAAAVMLLLKVDGVADAHSAYVLALANSFGGSLLVTASVSNLIVVQQARALGIDISFRDFARLGIPVTLVSLAGLVLWAALAA